jgi:hypothetical protein
VLRCKDDGSGFEPWRACESGASCIDGECSGGGGDVVGGDVSDTTGAGDAADTDELDSADITDGFGPDALVSCEDDGECAGMEGVAPPCVVGRCVGGACTLLPGPDFEDCDDGDSCTGPDVCSKGRCVGGPLDCDDSNPCTVDSCEAGLACVHTPAAGSCSDGDACTEGDTCADGACVPGTPICPCTEQADCLQYEDGDLCNGSLNCEGGKFCFVGPSTVVTCEVSAASAGCATAACGPSTGACAETLATNGTPCDDGDPCTVVSTCQTGVCAGASASCNDGNPCTDDACDPTTGCTHVANTLPCDDGNACTEGDACVDSVCKPGAWMSCDDSDACTVGERCEAEACVPGVNVCGGGACSTDADCDDGDGCNGKEVCDTTQSPGVCKTAPGSVVSCAAQNAANTEPCAAWQCEPTSGTCVKAPANGGATCDDGNACTIADHCVAGTCTAGAQRVCKDDNQCTSDSCNPVTGCVNAPKAGPCEDGSSCTTGDTCQGGLCVAGTNACVCTSDADCEALDDGDACNGALFCDLGQSPAVCVPGAIPKCDTPADPCMVALCDSALGTCAEEPAPDGTACAAATECTQAGECVAGVCKAPPIPCDDKDPCTTDHCVPGTGCAHDPADGVTCDDGSPCTLGDTCAAGACVPGFPVCTCLSDADCTEEVPNPCATPTCINYTCIPKPKSEGLPCDDGNPCSAAGFCSQGTCAAPPGPGCTGGSTYTLRLFAPSAGRAEMAGSTYELKLRSAPPGATQQATGAIYNVRPRRIEVIP